MRKNIFFLLIISMLLVGSSLRIFAENEVQTKQIEGGREASQKELPSMYAKSYALLDGDSGRLLCGNDMNNPMANASTTKIMTCILALENSDLNDVVTVSTNAVAQPKVHLGMKKDEQFYMKDLLYGLMLESYNDCAVAIAEHIDGSIEKFAERMNEKAVELGCQNTHFVTPNGLDKEDDVGDHHTTAEDLCRIMKYCAWDSPKSDVFLTITQKRSHSFCDLTGKNFCVNNHNLFLDMMDQAITRKTGYTAKAGYCYVAAVEEQGRKFCIALLACGWPEHKNYKWADAKKLFSYGLDHYHLYTCDDTNLDIENIKISGGCKKNALEEWGEKSSLSLYANNGPDSLTFLKADWDEVKVEKEIKKNVELPITEGTVLGSINFMINGKSLFQYDICAGEKIHGWDYSIFQNAVWKEFLIQ